MINEKQSIKMPEKGNNTLKFNNFQTIASTFCHLCRFGSNNRKDLHMHTRQQ